MAGKITTNSVVLGDSATDTQNFILKTNVDGTATLARGAAGTLGTVFGVNGSSAITGATLVTPALGTPASGVLTNCTGTVNALNAGLGVNQTWASQTRSIGTTYTNSTGKPIVVAITVQCTTAATIQGLIIGGAAVYSAAVSTASGYSGFTSIVPDGATYVTQTNGGTLTLVTWYELR
jgi:hypothetical protein